MIPDCTLVTGCFDLTKYNSYSRDLSESINKMSSLLEVPCYLIIFTDKNMYKYIKNKRDEFKLDKLTHYIVTELENLENFKYVEIVKKIEKNTIQQKMKEPVQKAILFVVVNLN